MWGEMGDDPSVFASSMIEMYGSEAEKTAKEYAEKHRRSGDTENCALWLAVAAIIQERRKN
jgi:hypothetical protein